MKKEPLKREPVPTDWTNSFTNQRSRVATEAECAAKWSGGKSGERFRCHLCGHRFIVGDVWRWVCHRLGNFMTCERCDGPDVKERWEAMVNEWRERFWWAHDHD